MEDIILRNNSMMYRRVTEPFGDMSELGLTNQNQDYTIRRFPRKWHDEFYVGAALYYNIDNEEFELAIARNTKESEVCGLILSLTDTYFDLISSGYMYWHDTHAALTLVEHTPMYLSETVPGGITFEQPQNIIKRVALFYKDVIMITVNSGLYWGPDNSMWNEQEAYTQEELDDIVSKLWWDRRHHG